LVRVARQRGIVHEDDLPAILGCSRAELKITIGIAFRWRRVDRCDSWLVAASSCEGRRAA
jgi:hypothetical protein